MKVSGIYDLYNAKKVNKENETDALGNVSGRGHVNVKSTMFDSELMIKSAVSTKDAYDRVSEDTADIDKLLGGGEQGKALCSEMIDRLAEVVNADNFDMYEEFGLAPDKDDPASILTVSERIEIELAAACEDYVPTGNISVSDIQAMYGNTGRTYEIAKELLSQGVTPDRDKIQSVEEALDKVAEIRNTGISSGMAEYLLVNNKQVSVDNVYMASHSVASVGAAGAAQSHVYQKLSEGDWESLKPQVESALEKVGFGTDADTMADAKWLVETKLPLTGENMYKLSQIRDINSQLQNGELNDDGWMTKFAKDMAFLDTAGESSLDYYNTIEGSSIEAVTILNEGTEEQVETLVMDGNEVTLLNLKRLQEDRTRASVSERNEIKRQEADDKRQSDKRGEAEAQRKVIAAKRTLEEARLKLTVSSGAFLIRNGFNINVSSLADTVEQLKVMESRLTGEIFANVGYSAATEDMELFSSTTAYMKEFASTPSYALGRVFSHEIAFSVTAITDYGSSESFRRSVAGMAYDTLGTKPDRTLGDSISKAFKNIPEMLKEMGLENTVMNNRAVRILAHNEMEINQDNIDRMKEMDTEVSRLIDNLTPKTTAYLIANGINPLNTDIPQLNDVLEQINSQIGRDSVEKYSQYLFKLDRKGEISSEDRERYIGIYRALNMIEKADRKAIGAIAKQGGELTMRNLLTAARSLRNSDIDVSVDDELGMTQELHIAENNIDNQLKQLETASFYQRAKENISPHLIDRTLHDSPDGGDALDLELQRFLQNMSDATFEMAYQAEEEADSRAYRAFMGEEFQNLKVVSEEAIRNIMEDGTATNMENLFGVSYMLGGGKRIYDRIPAASDDEKVNRSVEALKNEDNVEELESGIYELNEQVKQALMSKSTIRAEDIRQINSAVNYMREAADHQSYYVPVEVEGGNALLKLTLKRDEENRGRIDIRMYAQEEVMISVQAEDTEGNPGIYLRESAGISDERISGILDSVRASLAETKTGDREADSNRLFSIARQIIRQLT